MEFLKQWTLCVSTTLVISAVFSLFTPKGRMNTFYKLIISLFIFISFLYPLKSFDIEEFKVDAVFDEGNFADVEKSSYEIMINNQVKSVLEKNNVIGANVSSDIKFSNDEIEVNYVQIAVADEYDVNDIENMIFNSLGINARVIHSGQ
jgi:hypothetical protein